jgi:N-methylhydantoinase A
VGPGHRRLDGAESRRGELEAAWIELERRAQEWLADEQVPPEGRRFERGADLRYEHQSFELTCPLGAGPLTAARLRDLVATFHAEHRRLYSYDLPAAPVELVNLRLTAVGALPRREDRAAASAPTRTAEAVAGRRPVHFRGVGFVSTPCYAREALRPGMTLEGPALVEQDDATPLVAPGFRGRVDGALNLILERADG